MGQRPVVLAGAHGHGRWHLRNLRRLSAAGVVRLVGVCDHQRVSDTDLTGLGGTTGVDQDTDLGALLSRTGAEITILATPIHTHLPLARTTFAHGSHLLLEKPPTATLTEYETLRAETERSALACQVGFQSLGSAAVDAARDLLKRGAIGTVRGIGGAGAWVRGSAYFDRAPWAGRRRLDGHDVVDGALTNPFAHAVATALRLCDASRSIAQGSVELELFHAHEIESDDTSALRLRAPDGTPVTIAVTLCAERRHEPYLIAHGDKGHLILRYTLDEVELHRHGEDPVTTTHPRTDLLENLLAHLDGEAELLVPLAETAGFMNVLEAVRLAPPPRSIPPGAQRITDGEGGVQRHIHGIEELVDASAQQLALYSELGATWAAAPLAGPSTTTGAIT